MVRTIRFFRLSLTACFFFCFWLSEAQGQNSKLGNLSKSDGPIKYVAVGSSLSAGVRDGGLYRESQISAFPNLIAQQMGLMNFKQPLFGELSRNGIGYQKVEEQAGLLKFTNVPGLSLSENDLEKVVDQVDNLAIPFLKVSNIHVDESMRGSFLPTFERKSYSHIYRFIEKEKEGKTSYYSLIESKVDKIDFFTFEIGMHDFVSYYKNGGFGQSISLMVNEREGYFPENDLVQLLLSKGAKGVIANVPDVLNLPFFRCYKYNEISKRNGDQLFTQYNWKAGVRLVNENDIFVPSDNTNTLFTNVGAFGHSEEQPLGDEDIIGVEEKVNVNVYNSWIRAIADLNKIPVVDLYELYSAILVGDYVTEDGFKVDPTYPGGNFFSDDGIHPSKFGQAIIANEFIKTINSFYHSQIPLINITRIN